VAKRAHRPPILVAGRPEAAVDSAPVEWVAVEWVAVEWVAVEWVAVEWVAVEWVAVWPVVRTVMQRYRIRQLQK
jgi:hypothetical protein